MKIKSKIKLILTIIVIFLILAIIGYSVAIYSNHPFIEKWRTIYIETAMSTMTHQWLATSFIPESIINEVMQKNEQIQIDNLVDENKVIKHMRAKIWIGYPLGFSEEEKAKRNFLEIYSEIDVETLPEDIKYKDLCLVDEEAEGIKTTEGDSIYCLDTINGIIIVNVSGDGYVGKLCIVKDASKVTLGLSSKKYSGEYLVDIAKNNDAILAINGSGFMDPGGHGNGGTPVGLVIHNSEVLNKMATSGYWFNAGFDIENNLRIGTKIELSEFRDAVQFKPALIIDGEIKVEGSSGWGIQPRTTLAQKENKDVIFLIIDGRRPGYSIGTTVGECAKIVSRYGAIQAINLDGGSSSVLVYNGKTINRPSNGDKNGRYLPNGWIVPRVHNESEIEGENMDEE